MKMLQRALLAGLPIFALVGALLTPTAARPAEGEDVHRAMRASLYHLKAAREEVKDERFARYRERIERDIATAIEEIEGALREGKINTAYEPANGWGEKYKSFRNLRQALVELEIARTDIDRERSSWARKKELRLAIYDAYAHTNDALNELK